MPQQRADPTTIYPHLTIVLPDLDLKVVLIKTPEGTFCPIPPLCRQLGDINTQSQTDKLNADEKFIPFMRPLMAPTARGHKPSWCLRRHKIGDWLHTISPNRVNERFRGKYEDIQARITQNSDQAHFGVALASAIDPAPAPKSHPEQKSQIRTGEAQTKLHASIQLECECGRVHCIVIEPGNVVTYIGEMNRE